MKAEIAQIERNLAAIHSLLVSIRNPTISDMPDAFIVSSAAPFLQQSRWMVLACLESLLQVECQRTDRNVLADRFADTLAKGVPDYWTRNPISEGVIDTAVELGILNDAEKQLLLKEHSWDLPRDSDSALLIDELDHEVRSIQSIVSRCTAAQSIDKQSVEAVTRRRSPEIEPPNPDVNDAQVRAALETRFKGSLEREIDGTLGKILVFRYPPNTYPERIAVKTVDPNRVKASGALGAIQRFLHEVRHWITYRHCPLILTPFFHRSRAWLAVRCNAVL